MTNTYTDTAKQLIINDITDVDISTVTFNADELYLTTDSAVYSVNNVTPVNGNVTLDAANKDLSNLSTTGNAKFQAPITGGASTITSSDLTANKALIANASGKVAVSSVTSSELGYLLGVTSNVQTQLNGKQPTLESGTNIKTINSTSILGSGNISVGTVTSVNNVSPVNGNVSITIPSEVTETTVTNWGFTKNTGTVTSVNNVSPVNGNVTLSIPTVNNATLTIQKNSTTVKTFTANASSDVTCNITVPTKISDLTDDTSTYPIDKADTLTGLTSTVSELNILDGVTATASEINVLDGITATTTELNYVDGVTSAIQTQLNGKQETLSSGTNIKTINSTSLLGSGNISVLQNDATGSDSITIDGIPTSTSRSINIGANSRVVDETGVSFVSQSIAIGFSARVEQIGSSGILSNSMALGTEAKVSNASNAIQIGEGTNSTADTLQVKSYTLLNTSTGLIPDARLSTNIARTSSIQTLQTYSNIGKVGEIIDNDHVISINNPTLLTGVYGIIPNKFVTFNEPWEIGLKIKTGSSATTTYSQCILCWPKTERSVAIEISSDGHFLILISTDGSTSSNALGTYTVQANTDYWLKFKFDGSKYTLDYSLDGETFVTDITITSSTPVHDGYLMLGTYVSNSTISYNFFGEIDLKECYIKTKILSPTVYTDLWRGVGTAQTIDELVVSAPFVSSVDGQWVDSSITLCSGVTAPTTTTLSYSLSSYLPNDGHNYEVLCSATCTSGATNGDRCYVRISSDIITEGYLTVAYVRARSATSYYDGASFTIPVGTNRTIYLNPYDNNTGTISVVARGYRRIGTNS